MFEKWEDIVTHKGLYQISKQCAITKRIIKQLVVTIGVM